MTPIANVAREPNSALTEIEATCTCPITHVMMTDPVIAADGHTYGVDGTLILAQTLLGNPRVYWAPCPSGW